jgi:hypothetical protein
MKCLWRGAVGGWPLSGFFRVVSGGSVDVLEYEKESRLMC